MTITATRQWQIHVPKSIRELIGWRNPGKVDIHTEGDKIILKPRKSEVLSLIGKYKHLRPTKKIDLDNIRDYINYSNL